MSDDRPLLNQINLVVRDMDVMIDFYRRLGVEIAPATPPWDRHHRTLSTPDGLDFDLDSTEFATQWNRGWPLGRTGPVVGFRVASREAVDRIYEDLMNAGHTGQQPPYNTFWGARYAVVTDPEGNSVGAMSPLEKDSPANAPNRVAQNCCARSDCRDASFCAL